MTRHDWTMLALIGTSALGGMGITSVLSMRCLDPKVMELEILRETPVEVPLLHFGERDQHPTPHASYGLVLTVEPATRQFLTIDSRIKPVPTYRNLPLRKNSVSYAFKFQPIHVPTRKPQG